MSRTSNKNRKEIRKILKSYKEHKEGFTSDELNRSPFLKNMYEYGIKIMRGSISRYLRRKRGK